MELTRKLLDSTSLTLADQRQVTVICSTGDPDRAGDIIIQNGIDLTAYRKNPIVLWGHSADVPIARAIDINVKAGKLQATVQFPPEGEDEDSDWVYGKIKAGIVNATSVGFIPKEYEPLNPKEPWSGYKFKTSELLEFSFVSVPANSGCLIVGRSLFNGVDVPSLPSVSRSNGNVVDQVIAEGGSHEVRIPRNILEEAFRLAKTPRAVRQKYLAKSASADWQIGAADDLPIVDAGAWDAPAAAKRMLDEAGFSGDTPDIARAARGFLIHDAANPLLRSSYKLPFADIVGGELKAVAGGIHAAASRLPQTDAPQPALDDAREVLNSYEGNMNKSAQRRAAFETLRKDLDNVSWLASLLQSLAALEDWIEYEEQIEGDGSAISGRLAAVMNELGQILIDMTAEEVAELLSDEQDDDSDAMMLAARTPAQKLLVTLAAHVREKGGRSVSAANQALLTKAMDHHDAANQCIKDVLASNEPDEPADPDPADEPVVVVTLTAEQERAKRLEEAKALRQAVSAA